MGIKSFKIMEARYQTALHLVMLLHTKELFPCVPKYYSGFPFICQPFCAQKNAKYEKNQKLQPGDCQAGSFRAMVTMPDSIPATVCCVVGAPHPGCPLIQMPTLSALSSRNGKAFPVFLHKKHPTKSDV